MKTFLVQIKEEHTIDATNSLGHPVGYDNARKKQLLLPFPDYEMINLEDWMGMSYPKNSSHEVKNELKFLASEIDQRTDWEDEMIEYDKEVMTPFIDYADEYGIELDMTRVEDLIDQSAPIILILKKHYNRPRPAVLAKHLGLPLTNYPLKTANTPSYPSGHAVQGRLTAKLLADMMPIEHTNNVLEIGKRIGLSRQVAGAHYPSDTIFGIRLGDELYRLSKTSMEPDLTLESLKESLDYKNQEETEFGIDVVADIDKQIGSVSGEVSSDDRAGKKTNSKKIGVQILLKANERTKFVNLANDIVKADPDLSVEDPTGSRTTKDFAFIHKGLNKKIYVTTRPDSKRGGGAKADPNELMCAALCTMSSIPTINTIEDMDALILKVQGVIDSAKVIGYTQLEVEAMDKDYDNLCKAVSAAEAIPTKYLGADKVYLTGKAWSDDVKQFQVTKYGMKDFNASDFIIKKGKNYCGISLKKKKSSTTGDPTLINKGFTTLLQGSTFDTVRDDLDDASYIFYSKVIKVAQRFQQLRPKIAVDGDGNPWLTPALMKKLGKKAKNLSKTNWKTFVTGLPNELINYQLKKSRSLFKPMADVIEDNADLFADTLIKLILKTELKELQKVHFDFALVTGIGRVLKSGLKIEKGDYNDVDTMTTKLDELFKTGKPNMTLDKRKIQAFDKNSTAAMLYMNLSVGSNPVCDVTLRYKGNFASSPSFLATFSKDFKDSLK